MTDLYRVCLIFPDENPHAACFREIGLLILSALKSNNFDCDLSINNLHPDRINIIIGYHLITFHDNLKNFRYIPYQLEQLHSREFPFNSNMEAILRHALTIWDYSIENINFLKTKKLHARLLLPGYHENLEMIKEIKDEKKNFDILFYGSVGERRKKILDELAKHCKVKLLLGVYGEKRDDWTRRSKIILNVHHYSTLLFEAVRVSYLLNNRCTVLSENSTDYCFDKVNLCSARYENIVETCLDLLKNKEKREILRMQNYNDFKINYEMTKLIKNVL